MRSLLILALIAGSTAAIAAESAPQTVTLQPDKKDYPADAAAQKIEGAVLIKLVIEPTGQLSCAITDKAAPQLLKRRSCEVAVQHWNLAPNVKDGAVVKTEIPINMVWKLPSGPDAADFGGAVAMSPEYWIVPADYPPLAKRGGREGIAAIRFDVTPAGAAEHCTAEGTANEFTTAACHAIEKRAHFLPLFDDKGEPKATAAHYKARFTLGGR